MAAKKRAKRLVPPVPPLETFTTRLPLGLHAKLKIAAIHHKVSVQELVQRGVELALGEL
jgi:predicted HicB family RNase H-like nuclease